MSKSIKKAFIASAIFTQIFLLPKISSADSIILNKETTDGVNVRVKEDVNSEILGGIEDFTIYEIKGEDKDWYEIEFEGKKGYVGKEWFYKLNHTSITEITNLKSEPNSDSENLTDYKLQEKTKVTILEFIPDSEFVKVSYDENFKDNKKINIDDIAKLENSELLYELTDIPNPKNVKTITLEENQEEKEQKESPSVVTLTDMPETTNLKDIQDSNDESEEKAEIKEGYVKISSLAIGKKDPEDLEEIIDFYNNVNDHVASQLQREEEARNAIQEIRETRYITTITYNNIPVESQEVSTNPINSYELPVTGSQTGIELYQWASQFLGNPYVWGGVDPVRGIDCSGFTMQIYRQVGINLPHFAQSQQRYGVEVPFGMERAGDLVFFGTSLNNITHVGMADGNGNMIHASSPRTGIIVGPIRNPISIKRIVY